MKQYTTPHAQMMLRGHRRKAAGLDAFYEWCKRIGHYHAYETVERYRRIK